MTPIRIALALFLLMPTLALAAVVQTEAEAVPAAAQDAAVAETPVAAPGAPATSAQDAAPLAAEADAPAASEEKSPKKGSRDQAGQPKKPMKAKSQNKATKSVARKQDASATTGSARALEMTAQAPRTAPAAEEGTTTVPAPRTVLPPPAVADALAELAGATSPESAPAAAPIADPKLAAVLASLDGRPAVESPTPAGRPAVNPLARAGLMFLLAAMIGVGLLLHPRTRRLVFARLKGGLPAALQNEAISLAGSRNLGAGQRVVALEFEGRRLLVGLSAGRMDVLATIEADAPAPRLASFVGAEPPPEPPRPRREEPDEEPSDAMLEAPSADALLQAWTQAPTKSPAEALLDEEDSQQPWWMEGATREEKHRIAAAAAAEEGEAPEGSVAEAVIARLRAVRDPEPPEAAAAAEARPRHHLPRAVFGLLVAAGAATLPALLGLDVALAQELSSASPDLSVHLGGDAAGASTAVKLLVTLTLLSVAPAIVLSMTSFTRLIVVFSLLRQAVGVQQAPPNQVLVGLALFLTWFVMGPTFERVNDLAVQPYANGQVTEGEAVTAAMGPMRDFMMANTRENDLALFLRLSASDRPQTRADVPTRALVPAFLISELKTAFQIGFLIYLPFLIIDIVVSTVLLAMGMMVLPPVVISLPFKLLLFVFVDGWNLLVGSMVTSFA